MFVTFINVTIHELLDHFRTEITAPRDRGTVFERLMQSYLQNDPLYQNQFKLVVMWSQWEHRFGNDHGIDLVAEGHDGEFTAIQCKFFDPGHLIQKDDINSFFAESGKQFTVAGKKRSFAQRIIISTSDRWSEPAEKTLEGQTIPVTRIHVRELEQSPIDWSKFSLKKPEDLKLKEKKKLRPHQSEAVEKVTAAFKKADRGKLIMACGTGKTFTALKLAETTTQGDGLVLFMVPSISLLSQTLREWTAETQVPFHAFAVCSDSKVGKHSEDISKHDLQIPASTDTNSLIRGLEKLGRKKAMTVIFSTYQSIEVVAKAQKKGLPEFDLIICDEAHRTTGAKAAGEEESHFVRVHDQKFIQGKKRLYMTATPRIFGDAAKTKAEEADAELWSMDNESKFGKEIHRLGFGKAVGDHLLTDYKVLVLAIDEAIIDPRFQKSLADANSEIQIEDMAKMIGCWNGLSKRFKGEGSESEDQNPMKRAVAFARSIKDSKSIASSFQNVVSEYIKKNPALKDVLGCEVEHVDGTFNVLDRNTKLDWLKENTPANTCRILSNARCLSEGVDVPALDAVLFLNPRDSMVDVVQSVGRIMRKADGKKYGYVILPVGIPAGVPPEEALKDNKKYKVVWQVLQALRAHDDRFDAEVNKIELNKNRSNTIQVIGVHGGGDDNTQGEKSKGAGMTQLPLNLPEIEKWRDAIYAKIVLKCGSRPYWEDWAKDVAKFAGEHSKQIQALLKSNDPKTKKAFDKFLNGIRRNLNPSISENDAIEMLSQQLITKPVFDALFEHYQFTENNSVSKSMDSVLKIFKTKLPQSEAEALKKFYESVRMRVRGINNAEARQRVIKELYDRFFNVAFKKMSERLGIVYTPIEVVDFVIHSIEDVMKAEFGKSLSDEGVHILDPFTGTGTFIVRLLQSGIIKKDDLTRKFKSEVHANELVLLAYYIASINIEETYHEIMDGEYVPFSGGVLTDTFQLTEAPAQGNFEAALDEVHKRAEKQKKQPIQVIISNPPYSVGQGDENANNKNLEYPMLDSRIRSTYAAQSSATNKNSLYDSYIRAIRWATDRIGNEGIVGFVTNGDFIDSNSADGLRRVLPTDFSKLYVFNCRGNARTSGDQRQKEAGNVFGGGSRTPVAISILVKGKRKGDAADIFYHDIGDYFSREEKLSALAKFKSIAAVPWKSITPNTDGDWVNQRSTEFHSFLDIGSKDVEKRQTIFSKYSGGIKTNRDAWCYSFSMPTLRKAMRGMIDFYGKEAERLRKHIGKSTAKVDIDSFVIYDPKKISWNRGLKNDLGQLKQFSYQSQAEFIASYRPFCKSHVYFSKDFNDMVYHMPKIFPTKEHQNLVLSVIGVVDRKGFSVLLANVVPDLHLLDSGQYFPLYYYEKLEDQKTANMFGEQKPDKHGYIRRDAITDFALNEFKTKYTDAKITKENIFYYVYGLLHSPTYRSKYQNDLKKMLPRIPLLKDFWGYSKTGRALAEIHLGYETCEPYPLKEQIGEGAPKKPKDLYRVNEAGMKFPKEKKVEDKSQIIFNPHVRLTGIPLNAYNYVVNGKPAIECVMERYVITTDKDSGITNDPNEWSDDPRYIVDLVKRVVAVSLETNKLIAQLPAFELLGAP